MRFLALADVHATTNTPISRLDDFFDTQKKSRDFVISYAEQNNIEYIIISGDLFDVSRPPNMINLLNFYSEFTKKNKVIYIAGNHDLRYKSLDHYQESAVSILEKMNNFYFCKFPENNNNIFFSFCNFGESIPECPNNNKFNILIIHVFCAKNVPDFVDTGISAEELLDTTKYDLIITGDNHQWFIQNSNERILINPGCLVRNSIDLHGITPGFFDVSIDEITKKIDFCNFVENVDDDNSIWIDRHVEEQYNHKNISAITDILENEYISFDFYKNLDIAKKQLSCSFEIEKFIDKLVTSIEEEVD